jgi:hypothetical protein
VLSDPHSARLTAPIFLGLAQPQLVHALFICNASAFRWVGAQSRSSAMAKKKNKKKKSHGM